MAEKKLTKLLEQLHDELANIKGVDEKGRDLLRTLDDEIQKVLERSDEAESGDLSLDRLQETIEHFEVTHPALTSVLSGLISALSNAGI